MPQSRDHSTGHTAADRAATLLRAAIVAALVLPLGIWGYVVVETRSAALATAEADARRVATAVGEQALRLVEAQGLVLDLLDRVAGDRDCAALRADADLTGFLRTAADRAAQIEAVGVLDADGLICAANVPGWLDGRSRAFREYFTGARDAPAGHHLIGRGFIGLTSDVPVFSISRRRGGEPFTGVLLAIGDLRGLLAYWRDVVAVAPTQRVSLFRADGALVARSWEPLVIPPNPDGERRLAAIWGARPEGSATAASPLDGVRRVGAWRRLAGWDLAVTVSTTEDVILAPWRRNTLIYGLVALAAAAALGAALFAALRWVRHEQAATRRAAEEARHRQDAEERLRQAQKMEALGQLTGGVAHDFNNLLMAILGSLQMLRKRLPAGLAPGDERAARLVSNAVSGAERGAALTQRLLAFARRQPLSPESFDAPALVAGMHDLLRRSVGPAVRVETRLPASLSPALADTNQVELALLNLAVNARDAMPGGGTLTIAGREESVAAGAASLPGALAPGRYVVLSVADTGSGMDATTLARAAEPFFTTKGVGRGSGLGLSMVHGLAAQSGGRMVLDSRPGEGTTVELWLPRADMPPRAAEPAPAPPRHAHVASRVLLVDDDPLVLAGTAEMLEDLGHAVTVAASGEDALVRLRGAEVDLVLTDHLMPGMTGAALAEEVRRLRPGLPVILATGFADLPDEVGAGLPRLAKPFDLDALAEAVAVAVGPGVGPGRLVAADS